jgi:rSAM/selenodomain-associated transferase 2
LTTGGVKISVVLPTLNEAAVLAETLHRARQPGVHEIIVVDGGSSDGTVEIARHSADIVLTSPPGRALQMNAGAGGASGDVLLFLHADTLMPPGFAAEIAAACERAGVVGGRFDIELQPSSPLLWITGELINRRSRLTKVATGDQAIFIRHSVFARLGGYAEMPLMEDLDLSRRMKRAGRIACLRSRVITSSRRWLQDGVIRTILLMWILRLLYYAGVSPERLKRLYKNTR